VVRGCGTGIVDENPLAVDFDVYCLDKGYSGVFGIERGRESWRY